MLFTFEDVITVGLQSGWILAQIIAGLLIADFVSGLLHWMEDRYGGPSWPVVGRLIRSTVRHHKRPRGMTTSPFWRRNGPTMFIAGMFAMVFLLLGWINPLTVTGVLFGAFANEFHNWSHRKASENGPIITVLQNVGLIISPLEHARHHRGRKNTHYCAVTGWMNAPLESIRFWRRLEVLIRISFGERPRRDPSLKAYRARQASQSLQTVSLKSIS